jgi:glucose-1-phosphate cytidylyltransferase
MKVVLFCGGLGTRLREHSDTMPKPLVNIGIRPIIWHLMRYYSHFGHREFILALGYRGDMIREYFLNYNEALSNDFTLKGDRSIELHGSDMHDLSLTFVDTGLHANIGQRLLRVRKYLQGESMFLANYADGLTNLPLNTQIEELRSSDSIASFAAVSIAESFHAVDMDSAGYVSRIGAIADQDLLINGGYFVFRREIFDYINDGEELVEEPFQRLAAQRKLKGFRWSGFWRCMDTFKDKITYDRMEAQGTCPWKVWEPSGN